MPSLDCQSAAAADAAAASLSNPLQCIYWNVRSISGKKNVKQLQHYIKKNQVDLLFLSETWQRKGQQLPALLGYGLISCMSDQTGGRGGVACYYKQEYAAYISCHKNDPEGHYMWIKIDKALGFEQDLFAAVCYFPPANSTAYKGRNRLEPNFPYGSLNHDIFSLSMKKSCCDFLVVGDFNSRIGDAQAPEAHRHGLSRLSADKKINKFGLPLMDLCDKHDLIICNGVTKVWPKSGETTCRSKSVIDYLLAPVSRVRYLVKDIEILPLEEKSDHNAMNFTLRRPKPVQTNIPEPHQATAAADSPATTPSELLHRPLSEPVVSTNKAPSMDPAPDKMGCEPVSPKSVLMADDEWEACSPRSLNETGMPFFAEQGPGSLTGEVATVIPTRMSNYNATVAWWETKTARLLNNIMVDHRGSLRQHKQPQLQFAMLFKKGYMTRNLDALHNKPAVNGKCSGTNNNKPQLDLQRLPPLGSKDYWNRKIEEVTIQEPVFLLDKCEVITINSRPTSIASPGLVHMARLYVRAGTSYKGQSSDGSRMTTSGSWGAKGLKMGPGYRCTCMCPSHAHTHGREVLPPHPFFKNDTFTRTLTVVESSKFSTLLKNLKSAYDSSKLWSSIAHFKLTSKIAKAIR